MLFTTHVANAKIPDFVRNKVKGKAFAKSLGLQTAEVFNPPGQFIIKPVHGHSARGVQLACAAKIIVEERLVDARGFRPAVDHRFHCFHGKARLLQLSRAPEVGGRLVHNFFLLPRLSAMEVCSYPKGDLSVTPEMLERMIPLAERVAGAAGLDYLRVDLYNTTKGIFWGEACVTPGFAIARNKKITPAADELLGSWLEKPGPGA